MKSIAYIASVVVTAILLVVCLYSASFIKSGNRSLGQLENISGIPYPQNNGNIVILERLAHADVFLGQPVFGQVLKIHVTFIPHKTRVLSVGIRENSFWLSYNPTTLYISQQGDQPSPITREITVPLTDKFQDTDQSLDLMFFATSDGQARQSFPGIAVSDNTDWEVKSLTVAVNHQLPTKAETMDYLRSIIKRERAL